MRILTHTNFTIIFLVFITLSCSQNAEIKENTTEEQNTLFEISNEQFEYGKMEIGHAGTQVFEEKVNCNGYISAPAGSIAQINTQISGIITKIECNPGDNVKKGQVLAMLTSNELIELQQEFAETSAVLKGLKSDYERKKALFAEKIGAEKDFLNAEGEYKAILSKYSSLKLRLSQLNLNTTKIEEGELYSAFPLIAPINGNITRHEVVLGQFVEKQSMLMEIVDISKLQLKLSVFENDINRIKTGQLVHFKTLGEVGASHMAKITIIGKTIEPDTKSVECLAKIQNNGNTGFINRAFVEASIVVNQRESLALPTEAIQKSEQDYFVFQLEKKDDLNYYFKNRKVNTGIQSDGYTEIIGSEPLENILIHGAYNLQAE